jgi:hypothetical protein
MVEEDKTMARTKWWRDPAKEQFWRKAVRGWQRSGLSIRSYCAGQQLNEAKFYAWRREIARRDQEKKRSRPSGSRRQCRRGQQDEPVGCRDLFLPMNIVPEETLSSGRIDIVLSSGRVVRVEPGFDRLALRDVVATLEALPC